MTVVVEPGLNGKGEFSGRKGETIVKNFTLNTRFLTLSQTPTPVPTAGSVLMLPPSGVNTPRFLNEPAAGWGSGNTSTIHGPTMLFQVPRAFCGKNTPKRAPAKIINVITAFILISG
jgi:hypothetical protein